MTIIYCIASLYNSGGKDRVICAKANALVALGHNVFIITTCQKGRPSFFPLDERVLCVDLGINYEDYNTLPFLKRLRKAYELKKQHRAEFERQVNAIKPDIIISTFEEDAQIVLEAKYKCPKILEVHYSKERRYNEYQRGKYSLARILDWLRTKRDEYIAARFDCMVVLTDTDRKKWSMVKTVRTIANPLPFAAEEQSPLTNKKVLAVGRYCFEKDFASLIDIWSEIEPKHPDWGLEIVGDGYMRADLEGQIKHFGLKRVLLSYPTATIQEKYLAASCLVMTSRSEGLPMVLLEAMSCGLPVVSYDCPYGPREVITNNHDGYLVPLGDKERYRECLERLMSQSEHRKAMGVAAQKSSQRYSMDHIIKQWIELFESLHHRNEN